MGWIVGGLIIQFIQLLLGFDLLKLSNIFHSTCIIKNKVYNLIIAGNSCENMTSVKMMKKLQLQINNHSKPYKLPWLNRNTEIIMNNNVLCYFS